MSHWVVAPIVLPAFAGVLLLLAARGNRSRQRRIACVSTLALLGVAVWLVAQAADGSVQVYSLGGWPAPYGIVLVLDRLSALLVLLTCCWSPR